MLSLVLAGHRLVCGLRFGNSNKSYFLVASFTAPRVLHIDPKETQKLEDSQFSLAFAFIVRQLNSVKTGVCQSQRVVSWTDWC